MKRLFGIIVLAVVFGAAGFADAPAYLHYFKAEYKDGIMVVEWQSMREVGLEEYELWRKGAMTGQEFSRIDKEFKAQGDETVYTYRDTELFKVSGEPLEYQLVAVGTDGRQYTLVNHRTEYASTAVRRTWGSIKAMFQ